jgi:hypothetical protein
MNNFCDVLFDYIRMVAYGSVIISSFVQIHRRQYRTILLFGDIFFSLSLITVLLATNFFTIKTEVAADIILTPAAILWAILHYISLMKIDGKDKF